jgi:hypothetical protein
MLDMYDSALGELRASKLALQEQFFRGAEAAEAAFTEALAKAADALLATTAAADAAGGAGSGGSGSRRAAHGLDSAAGGGGSSGGSSGGAGGGGGGLFSELDEELAALLMDREAMASALAGAHEARVARILKREAELRGREERRCSGAVSDGRAGELARNRGRVAEIRALGAAARARVAAALAGADGTLLSEGGGPGGVLGQDSDR